MKWWTELVLCGLNCENPGLWLAAGRVLDQLRGAGRGRRGNVCTLQPGVSAQISHMDYSRNEIKRVKRFVLCFSLKQFFAAGR